MKEYTPTELKVEIASPPFPKEFFFGSKMGVKIEMGENFAGNILPEVSSTVPAPRDLWIQTWDLNFSMTDKENLQQVGTKKLFTPDEWTQILYAGVKPFPGRKRFFKIDFSFNISYVKVGNGKFAVYAVILPNDSWRFGANALDNRRRKDSGRRLLFRF